MGMFDDLTCEYPLPEGCEEYRNDTFQTKALECLMDHYIITKEGRLVEHRRYYEDHPTETRWNVLLKRDEPTRVLAHEAKIDQDYHGDINFYTGWQRQEWVEFGARFTEGTLSQIWLIEKRPLGAP